MRKALRRYKRIWTFVISFVVCLVALAVVHIISFRAISKKEITSDLYNDSAVGARLVSQKLVTLKTMAYQCSKELSAVKNFPTQSMYTILKSFQSEQGFSETHFISATGRNFMHTGNEIPVSYEETTLIRKLDFSGGVRFVVKKGPSGIRYLKAVYPIFEGNMRRGFFVGHCVLDNSFMDDILEYIETDCTIVIMDNSGEVILDNTEDGNVFQGMDNFIDTVGNSDDGFAKEFRNSLLFSQNGKQDFSFEGKEYGLSYCVVPQVEDWLVVALYPKAKYLSNFIGQRTGEFRLILFDIIMVFVVLSIVSVRSINREIKITSVAYYDTLTDVRTKEYFRQTAAKYIEEEKHIPYAVVAVDIEGFRYVNELFGHERGDEIIKYLAGMFKEIVGSKEIVARNTADYFELLIAEPSAFTEKMTDISKRLNEFARNIDVTYPLKVRAGFARCTGNTRNLFDLLDRANAARRTVNHSMSMIVVEYTDKIQESIKIREEIESTQDAAMEHDEFKLFLQPKWDVIEGHLSGAEALIRWIRRDGTMVYPDQFIPVFESNGFVEKTDFFMLEKACELLEKLGDEGYERVPISVNQSRILLMGEEYVRRVMNVINRYNIPKSLIELELTETAFFDDKQKMVSIMDELHRNKCIIAIDDFGSGYSSLNMLKDIPFDILKIDREFFGESEDGTGKIILEKVVEMAKALSAECICEGVETKAQEEMLRQIGCRYAQGYLYSKPIPADEFVQKFMKRTSGEEK